MRFTDIFVRRPVLASVVSLMILVLGIRAFGSLQVSNIRRPRTPSSPSPPPIPARTRTTVAGFVTTPLENAIAQANGIDDMTSISQTSTSTIILNLRLNDHFNRAMTEVILKISSVLNQLPLRRAAASDNGEGRPVARPADHRFRQRCAHAQPDY